MLMNGGVIAGLVLGLVTSFKPAWAPLTGPLYGVAEGLFLGGISAMLNASYPGVVVQAVLLTFGVALSMLAVYRARLVRVTDRFRLGVVAATGGLCFIYLVTALLHGFGVRVPFIHQAGPLGIVFSLFVVGLAALNLVLDFDFIERGAQGGAPHYMEWYGAFALMVTLVWLYIECLRLLVKFNSRD